MVGEASQPGRVEHPDTYPPATPEEVVCLPEGARVRVRWRMVPGAATYEVSRRSAEGAEDVLEAEITAVELIDLDPPLGEIIYFVVARDEVGNTSEPASCTVVMGAVP